MIKFAFDIESFSIGFGRRYMTDRLRFLIPPPQMDNFVHLFVVKLNSEVQCEI